MSQSQPGKFEGVANVELAHRLYDVTVDGGQDDELGDVADFGWYGLILGRRGDSIPIRSYIVYGDSVGFFDYLTYRNQKAAKKAWATLQQEYSDFLEERAQEAEAAVEELG